MLLNKLFYEFESEAIKKNISKISCEKTRRILEIQYENALVIKREFDEGGFFTYFEVPDYVERLTEEVKPFGTVQFNVNDLKYGVGFVLFVKNGVLDMLDCYTNDGNLPTEIKSFEVATDECQRDGSVDTL